MKITKGVDNVRELIPFMNRVFRKNFPTLLPKLYSDNYYPDCHFKVEEDGKLIGAIASIPFTLKVYESSLKAYGVGMVSCHPRHRGKGVMSAMVNAVIDDARANGGDFLYLDGNRQRYEYFGFVPCGLKHTFTLTTANFKHMPRAEEYSFIRLRDNSPQLEEVEKIYSTRDVIYVREHFYLTLKSWNVHHIYVILDEDKKVIGHIAAKWGKIVDFATTQPQNTAYIVRAFGEKYTKYFAKIDLYPSQSIEIASMARWAQVSTTTESTQFKILNYRHVVAVLLDMVTRTTTLSDCTINIAIEGIDTFSVTISSNVARVGDEIVGATTYKYSESEATLALFSPSLATYNGLPFRLPLFSTMQDNI